MKILVAERVGTLSGERVEVLEKKHQATCITNSKHSERTRRKSICCLGLHSRLRWLLAVKKKGEKKILQNLSVMFKGGRKKKIP